MESPANFPKSSHREYYAAYNAILQALMIDENRYELVSSFYGPGPVVGWYLTYIACMIAWTLHHRRKWGNSIDNDFIAVLAYPAIASGHIILQARSLEVSVETAEQFPRAIRSIEAALNLVDNSMMITGPAILVSLWHHCWARVLALFSSVTLGLIADSYLQSTIYKQSGSIQRLIYSRILSRLYFVDEQDTSLYFLGYNCLMWLALAFLIYWAIRDGTNPFRSSRKIANLRQRYRLYQSYLLARPASQVFALVFSTIFLPGLAILYFMLGVSNLTTQTGANYAWGRSWRPRRVFANLLPRTENSISELDQAAAAFAGGTVLAFSVYNAVLSQYKTWKIWEVTVPDIALTNMSS